MTKKIAVIGAGPMGLAVAYELSKHGAELAVFEADDRVGGMAASFNFGGVDIERYYHFYCTSDSALFEVLQEIKIADSLKWVETKMGYWYGGKIQKWGTPLALMKFDGLGIFDKFRYGLHAFVSVRKNKWTSLEHRDAASWIEKWVGPRAFEVLWRRLFEYKFYDLADDVSAAWIWSRIRRLGRSRYSIFKEKLGYIEGGTGTLLDAMGSSISTNGGVIHLSTPVTEVLMDETRVTAIKTENGIENFDIVISTVPLVIASKLMPQLPRDIQEKISSIKNIAVVCVIVKLRKSVSENFWLNTSDAEMDIPGIVEFSNLRPMDDHVVYVPFYLPQDHATYLLTDEEFVDKVKLYLLRINPELRNSDFLDTTVSRYKHAQPICPPGFATQLPPVKLPISGLWLADTSYYYPEDRGLSESFGLGRSIANSIIEELTV